MSKLNQKGYEELDQTPIAIPAHIKHRDQRDTMREMIRAELSKEAQDAGYESFEEADDFDVGDDYDPYSPYEEQFDPETGFSSFERLSAEETQPNGDTSDQLAEPGEQPGETTGKTAQTT